MSFTCSGKLVRPGLCIIHSGNFDPACYADINVVVSQRYRYASHEIKQHLCPYFVPGQRSPIFISGRYPHDLVNGTLAPLTVRTASNTSTPVNDGISSDRDLETWVDSTVSSPWFASVVVNEVERAKLAETFTEALAWSGHTSLRKIKITA